MRMAVVVCIRDLSKQYSHPLLFDRLVSPEGGIAVLCSASLTCLGVGSLNSPFYQKRYSDAINYYQNGILLVKYT